MKKLNLEVVKNALIATQANYFIKEESYEEEEALEEATEIVEDCLSNIYSIEVEDDQDIRLYEDCWCNIYPAIKGTYLVTLKDGRQFINRENEVEALFTVVELTSPDTVEL